MERVKIIECPRDAMQGLHDFIPTEIKADYINQLLACGFDTIDFGSFVSPKAIPQMRDTSEVLSKLNLSSESKLLAIIANERGAEDACEHDEIRYLGFPFSVSEEFQRRNTNSSIQDALVRVANIRELCEKNGKDLVVYLSMGFGNPYGETWNAEIVKKWCEELYVKYDVRIQALSDTIGSANPEIVSYLFRELIPSLPNVEFGAHLHTRPENASNLTKAAYEAGCRRFDGAIKGFGGCPMAKDDLTGNMPTELMLEWFNKSSISTGIDTAQFKEAFAHSSKVFTL
ncbi:MAG: hydroxymethylglutaryl-CoA lyase [Flavobacteriia bacterium]|jgi:hydroxymethylglutaryl-CoA lyase